MEIVTKVMEKSWKFVGKNVYEPWFMKLNESLLCATCGAMLSFCSHCPVFLNHVFWWFSLPTAVDGRVPEETARGGRGSVWREERREETEREREMEERWQRGREGEMEERRPGGETERQISTRWEGKRARLWERISRPWRKIPAGSWRGSAFSETQHFLSVQPQVRQTLRCWWGHERRGGVQEGGAKRLYVQSECRIQETCCWWWWWWCCACLEEEQCCAGDTDPAETHREERRPAGREQNYNNNNSEQVRIKCDFRRDFTRSHSELYTHNRRQLFNISLVKK